MKKWLFKINAGSIALILLGTLINIAGGMLASKLNLPWWLDSIGTFISAVTLGPVAGAISGALMNIIMELFSPGMMPFAKIYIWQCASMYFPLSAIFIFRNSIQGCNYALLPTCCGVVEFVARGICAFVSIKIHSFSLAVGCDPIAWVAAGIFGAIAWLWVRKDLEKVR